MADGQARPFFSFYFVVQVAMTIKKLSLSIHTRRPAEKKRLKLFHGAVFFSPLSFPVAVQCSHLDGQFD